MKQKRGYAVLVVGLDDKGFVFADPAWRDPSAVDQDVYEHVGRHRQDYHGRLILTADDLRRLAHELKLSSAETVRADLLDVAASYIGLLCCDCFQELASECTICPQLRREAQREATNEAGA
jgi:hypothetical protein